MNASKTLSTDGAQNKCAVFSDCIINAFYEKGHIWREAMAANKSQGVCSLRDPIPEAARELPDRQMSKTISAGGNCCEDNKTRRYDKE